VNKKNLNESLESAVEDPYSLFVFAMNATQTKETYTTRLDRFFRFIAIPENTIEERCKIFVEKGKNNNNWVLCEIRKFLQFQKERVEKLLLIKVGL
jgi:hypothetical protein